MADRDIIQVRRDLAANWTLINPVLAQGEPALEEDTDKLKFGDGVHAWNQLDYFRGGYIDGIIVNGEQPAHPGIYIVRPA